MAGDWHAIDLDLPDQIEVQTIIEMTDEPLDTVCGRLLLFWLWVNKSTTEAFVRGISTKTLSRRFGGDEQFWKAVDKSGWLVIREDGIEVPGYERRFGNSAKQRLQNNRRQAEHRATKDVTERVTDLSRIGHDSVTLECDTRHKKPSTREEKRREDIEEEKITSLQEQESKLPTFRTDPEFDPVVAEAWQSIATVAQANGVTVKSSPARRRKLSVALEGFSVDEITNAYRWLLTSPRAQSRREAGASIDTILDPEKTANYVEASKPEDAWKHPSRGDPGRRDITAKIHGTGARYEPGRDTTWE